MGLFVMHSLAYKDGKDISTMHERCMVTATSTHTYMYIRIYKTIIRVFPFKNMNTEGCDNQPKRVLLDRVIVHRKCKKDRFI